MSFSVSPMRIPFKTVLATVACSFSLLAVLTHAFYAYSIIPRTYVFTLSEKSNVVNSLPEPSMLTDIPPESLTFNHNYRYKNLKNVTHWRYLAYYCEEEASNKGLDVTDMDFAFTQTDAECKCHFKGMWYPRFTHSFADQDIDQFISKAILGLLLAFVVIESWLGYTHACSSNLNRNSLRQCIRRLTSKKENPRIRSEIEKARRHFAQRFMTLARLVVLMWLAASAIRIVRRFEAEVPGQELYGGEGLPLVFVWMVFALATQKPFNATAATLTWVNAALSAMFAWRYVTLPQKWYAFKSPSIWMLRLIQGLMFGNYRLSMSFQIIISMVDFLGARAHGILGDFSTHPEVTFNFGGYFWNQVIVLGLMSCVMWTFEKFRESQAKLLVEAREADNSRLLAYRLLSAMSDAVVYLDRNFCMSKSCPQLAGLVLRQSETLGSSFMSILRGEDRERFETNCRAVETHEGVTTNCDRYPHANVTHAHLVDANGSAFPVEIFCASFPNTEDDTCYILGIKEERDSSDPILAIPSLSLLEVQGDSAIAATNDGDASDTDISVTSSAGQERCPSDIAVWVNIFTPRLHIEQLSLGFTVFGPIMEYVNFWDLVVQQENDRLVSVKDFTDWIMDSIEYQLHHKDEASERVYPLFKIKLRNASHSPTVYSMKCHVDVDAQTPVGLEGAQVVRLIFSSVKVSNRRRAYREGAAIEIIQNLSLLSL